MKNNHLNIPPNLEEMKLWYKGQFPSGPRYDEIQAWLDQNPFLQEAMQGMDLDPELTGFKSKGFQSPSHKNHFKGWIFGLFIGLGFAIIAVSIWNPLTSPDTTTIESAVKQSYASKTKSSKITQLPNQPIEKQKPSDITPKTDNSAIDAPSSSLNTPLQPIASRMGQLPGLNQHGYPIQKINVCINIQGYEVYPYKERGAQKKMALPGTPADNGNVEDPQKEISYLAYLEETIIGYQEKDWTLVDEHCNTILKQYPDDINALYLKAKYVFAIDPSKALQLFEKTLTLNNGRLNEKEIKEYIRLSQ
jgi:hypothetical protein